MLKRHTIEALPPPMADADTGALASALTSRVLDMVAAEICKAENHITMNIVNPLLHMVYAQLYPYIIAGLAVVLLMVVLLVWLLASFILYSRPVSSRN
jgi:hypothetical protein